MGIRNRKKKPRDPYRSNYEDNIAKWMEDNEVDFTYETYSYQYEGPVRKNKSRCGKCGSTELVYDGWYTPDFFVGDSTIIEAKGRFTAADRRKIKAVRDSVPELKDKLRMMFMLDNKLNRNAKQRYSDWCEQEGIDYVVGTVPKKEWLNG
jgi:hypothetical protein